ncbi:MAG: hypothetical protein OXG15_01000 [Gammaproteobacteria bacterium]|nr:hypothetical protein [Gammaproteobacteria bacterium]
MSVAVALIGGFSVGVSVYSWLGKERTVQLPIAGSVNSERMQVFDPISPDSTHAEPTSTLNQALRVQSVLESTKLKSDFDQSVSMYLLLARAKEEDLNRYISESFSISSRNQRVAAFSIIFGRYAAINPNRALERALAIDQLTMQEKSNVIRSIFNEWTVGDLDAAAVAAANLSQQYKFSAASAIMWRSDFLSSDERAELARLIGPNDAWIDNAIASIRSDEAKVDPRAAFYDHIRVAAHTQKHYTELFGIVRHWFERDGATILPELHESLENPNARRFVLQNLIWNAIATKTATPVEILNVVAELPKQQDARQAMEHVFRSWANLDPKQSFEASLEFSGPLVTHDLRTSMLRIWAAKDFEGLLSEASSLPPEYRDAAVVQALGRMSINAPQEAIHHARNLDTHARRIAARDEIVAQWSNADAKTAFEWLMNDGFSENDESVPSIWRQTFSKYIEQNFDAAQAYASTYEGALKNQLMEKVGSHLIRSDIDKAIDFLPNVKGKWHTFLQNDIGRELARQNPIRALKFGETVPASQRDEYYVAMINAWVDEDVAALYDNIQRVPETHQSFAAEQALYRDENRQYLSERQIKRLESMVTTEEVIVNSWD